MGVCPALGRLQLAAAGVYSQGLAAFCSEAGSWAEKGASVAVAQQLLSKHTRQSPSDLHRLPGLSRALSWDYAEGHLSSPFRLQRGRFPAFAGLAPASWPGASVCYTLWFLPALSFYC